jgi:hypothetical protein
LRQAPFEAKLSGALKEMRLGRLVTPIFFRIHIEKMTGHRATLQVLNLSTPACSFDHESLDSKQTGARQ